MQRGAIVRRCQQAIVRRKRRSEKRAEKLQRAIRLPLSVGIERKRDECVLGMPWADAAHKGNTPHPFPAPVELNAKTEYRKIIAIIYYIVLNAKSGWANPDQSIDSGLFSKDDFRIFDSSQPLARSAPRIQPLSAQQILLLISPRHCFDADCDSSANRNNPFRCRRLLTMRTMIFIASISYSQFLLCILALNKSVLLQYFLLVICIYSPAGSIARRWASCIHFAYLKCNKSHRINYEAPN